VMHADVITLLFTFALPVLIFPPKVLPDEEFPPVFAFEVIAVIIWASQLVLMVFWNLGVGVGVIVFVAVGVGVFTIGVMLGVIVGVDVGVAVGVSDGVTVAVGVGVEV
jgi:hypothetical protein